MTNEELQKELMEYPKDAKVDFDCDKFMEDKVIYLIKYDRILHECSY
jgi:hypothetical protein